MAKKRGTSLIIVPFEVSFKPSGELIVAHFFFLFIELTSSFEYMLIFKILVNCAKFRPDWTKIIVSESLENTSLSV